MIQKNYISGGASSHCQLWGSRSKWRLGKGENWDNDNDDDDDEEEEEEEEWKEKEDPMMISIEYNALHCIAMIPREVLG